jgi:hypothetical protein
VLLAGVVATTATDLLVLVVTLDNVLLFTVGVVDAALLELITLLEVAATLELAAFTELEAGLVPESDPPNVGTTTGPVGESSLLTQPVLAVRAAGQAT